MQLEIKTTCYLTQIYIACCQNALSSSPLCLCHQRQHRISLRKIAVNLLLLTHGGPQSSADNKHRKFRWLTKTLITENFISLSFICSEMPHALRMQITQGMLPIFRSYKRHNKKLTCAALGCLNWIGGLSWRQWKEETDAPKEHLKGAQVLLFGGGFCTGVNYLMKGTRCPWQCLALWPPAVSWWGGKRSTTAQPIRDSNFTLVLPACLPLSVTREHNRSALPVNQTYYEFILLSGGQRQSALLAAGSLFHIN